MKSVLLSLLVTLGCAGFAAKPKQSKQPNVVFILSDNQSYWEFGCHGNTVVKTPNIDRLATESVDFRHFYATPYCSPSRAEFLTGRYAMRYGIYNTIGGVSQLPGSATTLAELFRARGYRTGMFGKWHLGESYPMRPEDQGFDEAFWHGGGGVGQLPDYYGNTLFDTTFIESDKPVPTKGFCTDRIFDRAIRFIGENRERRFLCYLPTPVTHKPWAAPEKYRKTYEALGMKAGDAAGYGQMTNLDENVGRLLAALDRMKLRQNTILIFATDQGMGREAPAPDMSLPQIRGGHRAYDWANQVAFMIRYPNRISKTGYVQPGLAGAVDLLPTLATWCGLQPAEGESPDGISLAKYLENPELTWPSDRDLVTQCPRGRIPKKWTNAVVRRGPWRLTSPEELFNAEKDPRQGQNIASDHPDLVRQLAGVYENWWQEFATQPPSIPRAVIGHRDRSEVRLTSMDWYRGGNPWTQSNIRRGRGKGTWAVEVSQAGRYRIELRRYPREADQPVGAVKASVQVGDQESHTTLNADAQSAVLTLRLAAGETDLSGDFQDSAGKPIGVFFAYIRRLN
jgi:arylsulfatase A-like enzyme